MLVIVVKQKMQTLSGMIGGLKILDGEWNHEDSLMEWNIYKWVPHKQMSKCQKFNTTLAISFCTWTFDHLDEKFYFQDASKVIGIHVPFMIGIQIPSQLQSMVSLCDNGVVSMDVTFDTNNVKFHLFRLMVFNAHCIKLPITWIITSCQIWNDFTKWLTPLREELWGKLLKWRPSCFIVDDVSQKLRTLWWVLFPIYLSYLILHTCNYVKNSSHIFHL